MNKTGQASMPKPPALDTKGRVETTDDIVTGDEILFYEASWNTGFNRSSQISPRQAGCRVIVAQVVREGYGPGKARHTFTLRVIASSGHEPIKPGTVIWRKGKNLFCNGCWRRLRECESPREDARQKKGNSSDKRNRRVGEGEARQ